MTDTRYHNLHTQKDIRGDFNEETVPQNPINIEAVFTCRHFELPATYNYEHAHESHQEYELLYIEKGPYYDISEEKAVEMHSDDAVIYGRNYPHKSCCDGKHSASVFVATFLCDSELMKQHFPDNSRTFVRITPEQRKILALAFNAGVKAYDINDRFNKLKCEPPFIDRQIYVNYIEILLLEIIKSLRKEDHNEKVFFKHADKQSDVTSKVITILESKVYSYVTIDELCKQLGYSRGHICNHFKRDTGKTVNAYFQLLKIGEAKRLILETSQDLNSISEVLGYNNPQYFSKVFRKLTGHTPGHFRKTIFKGSVETAKIK